MEIKNFSSQNTPSGMKKFKISKIIESEDSNNKSFDFQDKKKKAVDIF